MNRWNVIRLDPSRGLGSHAVAWDALNKSLFNSHPMLDSQFISELLIHYGSGSIVLCVLNANGAPQAMCLMRSTRPGLWSTFLPSQAQIGPMLLTDPVHIPHLLPKLPGYALRVDMLGVDPVFSNFRMNEPLLVNRMDHALTMNVSLTGTFEEYWASRPKKLIQDMDRYRQRVLTDSIAQKLVRIANVSDLEEANSRYAHLESQGWKEKESAALGTSGNQQKFYTDVLLRFGTTPKEAIVYELWLGDTLAASQLLIFEGRMAVILKTTFDENLSHYAPGRLLLFLTIQDLFKNNNANIVEFYTDANMDQLGWATDQRWVAHWSYYRNAFSVGLNGFLGITASAFRNSDSTSDASNLDSVEVHHHINQLPDDVQQLFAISESEDFQFGVDWYRNLVETVYQKHTGLHIYVLRRSGQPIAALPMLANKTAMGWDLVALSNFYTSLYSPALTPEVRYRALSVLITTILKVRAHVPLKSMRFSPMDPESMGYRRLKNALHAAGLAEFGYFCFGNWYLRHPQNWPAYLAGRPGSTRSTIKRTTKKFTTVGGSLQIVEGGADLDKAVAAYEQVYTSSWKVPEPFPNFIRGLAHMCAAKGWLRLGVAWLEGQPIAAQLWVVANGKANIYKLAYDEAYKTHAAGTVLTATLMAHAIDTDRVTEIDYLTGDDPYKKDWMNARRERWGIVAYNPKTIGGIIGLFKELTARGLKPAWVRLQSFWLKYSRPEKLL